MKYDKTVIADEIQKTALGEAYYGNALRVAKDFDFLSREEVSVLEKYLTGKTWLGNHFALQDIAIKIRGHTSR